VVHRYFVLCLVGVWQRNFEPVVCVYGTAGCASSRHNLYDILIAVYTVLDS
jgi:hypothetical protein